MADEKHSFPTMAFQQFQHQLHLKVEKVKGQVEEDQN